MARDAQARRSRLDGPLARLAALAVFATCAAAIGWSWYRADPPRPAPIAAPDRAPRERPAAATGGGDACADRLRREMEARAGGANLTAEQRMMLRQRVAAECR